MSFASCCFFALAVLELAVIHDPANRRLGRRRDLDQIELRRFRHRQRVREGYDADLLAFDTDQADFGGVDFAVDPLLLCPELLSILQSIKK